MIAALFDTYSAAERALQALLGSGTARDRIALVGKKPGAEVSSISGFHDLERDDDLAALADLNLPEEDRRTFEAGLRHGCSLIAARIDREQMEEAMAVIETFEPLDLDRRSEAWQRDHDSASARAGAETGPGAPLGAGLTAGGQAGQTNTAAAPGMGSLAGATHDLGSADLRSGDAVHSGAGRASTAAAGPAGEGRAGRPGVLEAGRAFRRDMNLAGRVRAYRQD
jgi:hypothetical protein